MKLFYTLLLAITILTGASAQQNTKPEVVKDTAYVNMYNKLRALYLKQLDSESHKRSEKISMAFMKKMKFDGDFSNVKGEDGMLSWIKENIEKTSFASYEEATKEYNIYMEAFKADEKENAAYFSYMKEVRKSKYGREIVMAVRLNKGTGEDPKETDEYKAAYAKLKDLFIKQKASDSYIKLDALQKAFYKKANFSFRKDKLAVNQTILSWVAQNLSKTIFTSLSEAEMEWGVVEFAQETEEKENAEFHAFKSEALHKYGPYMHTDVMIEVMTAE